MLQKRVAWMMFAVICLMLHQGGSASAKRLMHQPVAEISDNDLFLNNIAEEDLKDEGLEDIGTSGSAEEEVTEESRSGVTSPSEGDCSPAARRHTDRYIDSVLGEVRPKLPEPAFLPERVGRFRLFNGTLSNLATLRRSGPALVRCTDDTFSFLVPVALRNVTGRYFWETDAGVPVFRGIIDASIGYVDADVLYTRINRGGKREARVDKLTITRLSGVSVKFDGLGPLNAVASRFTNLVVRFFSRGVSRALEGPVKHAINEELKNVEKYELYYR